MIQLTKDQKEKLWDIYLKYEDRNVTSALTREIERDIVIALGADGAQLLIDHNNTGINIDVVFRLAAS